MKLSVLQPLAVALLASRAAAAPIAGGNQNYVQRLVNSFLNANRKESITSVSLETQAPWSQTSVSEATSISMTSRDEESKITWPQTSALTSWETPSVSSVVGAPSHQIESTSESSQGAGNVFNGVSSVTSSELTTSSVTSISRDQDAHTVWSTYFNNEPTTPTTSANLAPILSSSSVQDFSVPPTEPASSSSLSTEGFTNTQEPSETIGKSGAYTGIESSSVAYTPETFSSLTATFSDLKSEQNSWPVASLAPAETFWPVVSSSYDNASAPAVTASSSPVEVSLGESSVLTPEPESDSLQQPTSSSFEHESSESFTLPTTSSSSFEWAPSPALAPPVSTESSEDFATGPSFATSESEAQWPSELPTVISPTPSTLAESSASENESSTWSTADPTSELTPVPASVSTASEESPIPFTQLPTTTSFPLEPATSRTPPIVPSELFESLSNDGSHLSEDQGPTEITPASSSETPTIMIPPLPVSESSVNSFTYEPATSAVPEPTSAVPGPTSTPVPEPTFESTLEPSLAPTLAPTSSVISVGTLSSTETIPSEQPQSDYHTSEEPESTPSTAHTGEPNMTTSSLSTARGATETSAVIPDSSEGTSSTSTSESAFPVNNLVSSETSSYEPGLLSPSTVTTSPTSVANESESSWTPFVTTASTPATDEIVSSLPSSVTTSLSDESQESGETSSIDFFDTALSSFALSESISTSAAQEYSADKSQQSPSVTTSVDSVQEQSSGFTVTTSSGAEDMTSTATADTTSVVTAPAQPAPPVTSSFVSAVSYTLQSSTTSKWVPTQIIADTQTGSALPASTDRPVTQTSGLPKAITPATTAAPGPEYGLVTVGFKEELNYPFVVGHSLSSAQIFAYLPDILNYPFSSESSFAGVSVKRLVPYTAQDVGYVITVAEVYFPISAIPSLQTLVLATNSKLYNNPDQTSEKLALLIDIRIPLVGLQTDGQTADTSSLGNGSMDKSSSLTTLKNSVVGGVVAGASVGTFAYMALMVLLFRRYKKKKSVELPPSDSESSIDSTHQTPLSCGSNTTRPPISNPMFAQNSLGWSN